MNQTRKQKDTRNQEPQLEVCKPRTFPIANLVFPEPRNNLPVVCKLKPTPARKTPSTSSPGKPSFHTNPPNDVSQKGRLQGSYRIDAGLAAPGRHAIELREQNQPLRTENSFLRSGILASKPRAVR